MNEIETLRAAAAMIRERTLGLLASIEKEPNPQAVLSYRPGPGRAHIGWQLMHIAVTEELFATERLMPGSKADFADLVPRFKGGSTPDDNVPTAEQIRQVLTASRAHLESTLAGVRVEQLGEVPEPLRERGWTYLTVLQVLNWHEAHHHGQAHITFNLWKASRAG